MTTCHTAMCSPQESASIPHFGLWCNPAVHNVLGCPKFKQPSSVLARREHQSRKEARRDSRGQPLQQSLPQRYPMRIPSDHTNQLSKKKRPLAYNSKLGRASANTGSHVYYYVDVNSNVALGSASANTGSHVFPVLANATIFYE